MNAVEAFELTTGGGATDFARLIAACEAFGPYCLIGGLAVNCYVEPVYTLDAAIVVERMPSPHAFSAVSELRIQFTTDERYQRFLSRAVDAIVLGTSVKVASLEDVTRGKLWAYTDSSRRLSKRKKDELDLIRLGEAYPKLRLLFPEELMKQFEQ